MFNITVLCILAACFFEFVLSDKMISPGRWEVLAVEQCANADQYEYKAEINRQSYNRTHGIFDAILELSNPMDDKVGCKISICKEVDGGCKDYYTVTDNNCFGLAKKTCEGNFKNVREMIGMEREDYIEAGKYVVDGYMCDYCELPCESVIGVFWAEVLLLDGTGMIKGCIKVKVDFREYNDDEQMCLRCQEEDGGF